MNKIGSIFVWFVFYLLALGAAGLGEAFSGHLSLNFLLIFLALFFFFFNLWPTLFLGWFSGFLVDQLTFSNYHFWLYPLIIVLAWLLGQFFNLKYFNSRLLVSGLMIFSYFLGLFLFGLAKNNFFPLSYIFCSFLATLFFDIFIFWIINKIKNESVSR